ncbi:MAG: hypothetical protein P4L85_02715 [Paludisphaera borealis]|uniref:hypothetical protein n=1 Tax=Paludisphaera borealis TaxID=1387353 RepID=UPI00283C4EBE|nr:hypothetical protein [Paludisphaera borealis]MDR3618234.1 hypothetical protein [Paludisphaera borealis]
MYCNTLAPIDDARISVGYVRDELRLPENHRSASSPEYYIVILDRALAALARLGGFKAQPQVRTIADGIDVDFEDSAEWPAFALPPSPEDAPEFKPSPDDLREYAQWCQFHERVEMVNEGVDRASGHMTDADLAAAGLPVG